MQGSLFSSQSLGKSLSLSRHRQQASQGVGLASTVINFAVSSSPSSSSCWPARWSLSSLKGGRSFEHQLAAHPHLAAPSTAGASITIFAPQFTNHNDPLISANRKSPLLWRTMSTGGSAAGGGGCGREGPAKAIVAEQMSQAVQSTANLLHLMQNSSPAQAQLNKLPKNLLAKVSTIKNTEQVLEQMPRVISSLDAYMENGLQNIPHLKTVVQLLANMESSQLNSLSSALPLQKELEPGNHPQGMD